MTVIKKTPVSWYYGSYGFLSPLCVSGICKRGADAGWGTYV